MMFLASLAMRNLFRNARRTFITGLTVVCGVALQILGWGLVDGLDENFLRASRTTLTGDILMRPEGYPTDGLTYPMDETRPAPDIAAHVEAAVAPRTLFTGRIVLGSEASRMVGIVYDPVLDPKVFPRENWKLEGAWPTEGAAEIVLGSRIAELLEAKPGTEVVIQTRTVDGAQNAYTYKISGLVTTDNAQIDSLAAFLPVGIADQLLTLGDRRSHIALKLPPRSDATAAQAKLTGLGWTVRTTEEEAADLLAINTVRRVALMILVGIIMIIAALGIANTVIMAAYERVREIGTLLSLGMPRRNVGGMFLLEGLVLGLGAGLAGAILGGLLVSYWQANGIVLNDEAMNASQEMAVSAYIYTKFRWPPVLFALGFSTIIATLASAWPAHMASSLNPADAVRAD